MSPYHVAQICENGHCLTSSVNQYPERGTNFCTICGRPTISQCPVCKADINGMYYCEDVILCGHYSVPSFCHNCGEPYPWTQSALETATELILEDEKMESERRAQLVAALPDVISETPRTSLAVIRIKKALATAGKFTAEGIRQFVIDFGCELAKSQLGL